MYLFLIPENVFTLYIVKAYIYLVAKYWSIIITCEARHVFINNGIYTQGMSYDRLNCQLHKKCRKLTAMQSTRITYQKHKARVSRLIY